MNHNQVDRIIELASQRSDLVALYLSGSTASGTATPISDVDLATWLRVGLTPGEQRKAQLSLIRQVADILGHDRVDVVVLNQAAPAVRYHLLRTSKLLYGADESQRVSLEAHAIGSYFDWMPALRLHQQALRDRLSTGRFGRGR